MSIVNTRVEFLGFVHCKCSMKCHYEHITEFVSCMLNFVGNMEQYVNLLSQGDNGWDGNLDWLVVEEQATSIETPSSSTGQNNRRSKKICEEEDKMLVPA